MIFSNYIEIAETLQEKAITAIRAAGFDTQFGCSNVSCSRYIEVFINESQDGDLDIFKLRFSDHDDRYGSDKTIRFDHDVEEIEDDFGDTELQVSENAIANMVQEAVEAVKSAKENI